MFAIQPPSLPSAAQMLLTIDPAGEPAGDGLFEAQFSALLASAVPAAAQAEPVNAPARAVLPGASGGKDEAASGKQGGNILPDQIAGLAAAQGEGEPALAASDIPQELAPDSAVAEAVPAPATVTLQLVLAQIAAPTLSASSQKPTARQGEAAQAIALAPASGAALSPRPGLPAPAATAPAAPAIPAIRIPLALPSGNAPRQPKGEIDAAIAQPETPALSAHVVHQPVVQAQAAMLATVQQPGKAGDPAAPPAPPVPLDVFVAQTPAQTGAELASVVLDAVVVPPQALAAPANAAAISSTPAAAQPHDFAALVDRLVEARQAVQSSLTSQTVQASIQHAEFGRVSMSFQQDPAGMTVSFASPDPDLARAVQNLAPAAMSTDIRPADAGAASQRQDGQRPDGQRQDWQGGGAASSGQQQSQLQGQPSAQQQRGQTAQREAPLGSAPQDRLAGNDDEALSSSRSGIFA